MENPRIVIGTSSNQSYYNDQNTVDAGLNNNDFQANDLYEYDGESTAKNIKGHLKQFLAPNDNEHHSPNLNFLDSICVRVNQTLVIPKIFYFFFFAAFGSLFPLMGIYFKQMAMSPYQVGILFGFKPFVEFFSVPFWANLSERYRKGKIFLIISIICWILFTLGVGFIKPPVKYCLVHNDTNIFLDSVVDYSAIKPIENKAPKNILISGGGSVISKRSADDSNYPDLGSIGLILKKRADTNDENGDDNDGDERHFKVLNVTKIVRRRKTTKRTPSAASLDELEFGPNDVKGKLVTIKSSVSDAIDNVKEEIVSESQISKEESNENEKESENSVDESISDSIDDVVHQSQQEQEDKAILSPTQVPKNYYFGPSPLESGKNKKIILLNHSRFDLVKPSLQTSIVYMRNDVHKIFVVFLVFILLGEFFSAPAITLADTCTLQYLGPQRIDLYGRQRMFGSLGWGLAMFIVGILLDKSENFTDHPCGKAGPDERNYTVCFAIFSVLMGAALCVATQMKFDYGDNEEIPLKSMVKTEVKKLRGKHNSQFDRKQFVNEEADDSGDEYSSQNAGRNEHGNQHHDPSKTEMINQETSKQRYVRLAKLCMSVKHISFLFMVWFMGIGVGLVFTFLFWHLQDLGGSPTLYGMASVINHVSELIAYYFVDQIVSKFGHMKIFYAALLGNAIRFVYVSLLWAPYWILPFEFIQGITHALLWATATSYFTQSVPDDLRSTAQGILQSVHFGLGRGCGAVFGGILITIFESKITFGVYGILSLFVMFGLIAINLWYSDMNVTKGQDHLYGHSQANNNDDYSNLDGKKSGFNGDQVPEINNAINPRMMDTNIYYQPKNESDKATPTKSVPMVPQGVPGGSYNWSK